MIEEDDALLVETEDELRLMRLWGAPSYISDWVRELGDFRENANENGTEKQKENVETGPKVGQCGKRTRVKRWFLPFTYHSLTCFG